MAGLSGGGGGWGGYDDDDWGLSAEQLDQMERDAIRQLAERKASASAASTAPIPASPLGATSPLPSRATVPAAAVSSPLGGNHPATRASLEARFGKVRVLSAPLLIWGFLVGAVRIGSVIGYWTYG
jgi:SWI/SNF-related matrix-associated actin-dependent regulator of chromatin subfamily A-like protein 1